MIIHLTRGAQALSASVIYNFHQFCNVIVVRLHRTTCTDKDDLVIFYDSLDNKWKEVTRLEDNEPIFFQQILLRLSNVIREAQKVFNQNIT